MSHLDDLHQLVHAALPWKQRLPQQQLRHHAPHAPHLQRKVAAGQGTGVLDIWGHVWVQDNSSAITHPTLHTCGSGSRRQLGHWGTRLKHSVSWRHALQLRVAALMSRPLLRPCPTTQPSRGCTLASPLPLSTALPAALTSMATV